MMKYQGYFLYVITLFFTCMSLCCHQPADTSSASSASKEIRPQHMRIIILIDRSGSQVKRSNFDTVPQDALQVLSNHIRAVGGEVALSVIHEQPHKFVRTFPITPPTPPTPIEFSRNPYKQFEEKSALEELQQKYKAEKARFDKAFDVQWNNFLKDVKDLVEVKTKALGKTTDIWSPLFRTEVFFQERGLFPTPTFDCVVLISDGLDTSGKSYSDVKFDFDVYLVNDSSRDGGIGIFKYCLVNTPHIYESPLVAFKAAIFDSQLKKGREHEGKK